MNISPVAHFYSPFTTKFGIPRQAGLVQDLSGYIVFEKAYQTCDAVRGMEDFDYLWLIWGFSANRHESRGVTVRPPRLGGNKHLGVFATRSPFRPTPLGLSSVLIDHIDYDAPNAPVIYVKGADLMDGTPIYDIKPYVPYTDAHADARGGFVDTTTWEPLEVSISESIREELKKNSVDPDILQKVLEQDPRPQYHSDNERIYGMPFGNYDIRFKVDDKVLTVVEVKKLPKNLHS